MTTTDDYEFAADLNHLRDLGDQLLTHADPTQLQAIHDDWPTRPILTPGWRGILIPDYVPFPRGMFYRLRRLLRARRYARHHATARLLDPGWLAAIKPGSNP